MKEVCDLPSNFRSQMSLDEFFSKKGIAGISGIDTRKLTRIIRNHGVLKGRIVDIEADENQIIAELKAQSLPTNQIETVSTKTPFSAPGRGFKVVLIDFGAKLGIIRELSQRNCDITVVSHDTTAEEILLMAPDGIMLSNGPGDPQDVPHAHETVRKLLGKVPIFDMYGASGGRFGLWG